MASKAQRKEGLIAIEIIHRVFVAMHCGQLLKRSLKLSVSGNCTLKGKDGYKIVLC